MRCTGVARVLFCLGILTAAGCVETDMSPSALFKSPVQTPRPAEEILINNSDFNKPYKILGPVQYTLKSPVSLFSDQIELREKAIDFLKNQTYAQFGDDVDAIIDTKVEESTADNIEGKFNIIRIQGVAVSFEDEVNQSGKTTVKRVFKRKHKSAKKIILVRKAKPAKKLVEKSAEKPRIQEVEVSPTEMLK
jgi:hypothetical protein